MIKDFFNKAKYSLIVLFWLSLFIYFRFFRKQIPYNFSEVKDIITQKLFFFQIGFIILHVILLSYTIFILCVKGNTKIRNTSIIIYINNLMQNMLITPFTYTRDIIAPKIPYSAPLRKL